MGTQTAMTHSFDSKLPNAGTTIFTVMSQMAVDHGAINLSQGFPDFDGPEPLKAALRHYVDQGLNQYAPLAGVRELREQIALKVGALYGHTACPEKNITVVPGATEAIYCAIQAAVRRGDEVIVFDPAYDSYQPSIELAGGKTVHVPLSAPDFQVDWERVKDAITASTRMIIINTPHNPTGTVWSAADMRQLSALIGNSSILLLSDEVYEHLVYDGQRHESVLRYPELAERAFVISSFGKTYHVTGWKTGYCIAADFLMQEFRKVHQFVSFVGVTPIQHALADFMEHHPSHCLELPDFYQAKRDLFRQALDQSRFRLLHSSGTYFQLADYREISDQPDTEFVKYLTQQVGVAAIPVSVFYETPPADRIVRFCFCKEDTTLKRAADILARC